ncbi:hypothetical protein HY524_02160 [Candidatus Berkelbacteria bacterium]|nr:hypothetical protein [Candidatus Berkelbacteria bacterium]
MSMVKDQTVHTALYTRRVKLVEWRSQQGSALLITMIVITVLGTIAFAIGSSTIASFRRQSQIEDSLNAYQAAVSGLEDGLLRWKFDKDTETPVTRTNAGRANESGDFDCTTATRPTTSSTYYDRVNLTKGTVTYCLNPATAAVPDPSDIVYDLKIHYKLDPGQPEIVTSQPTAGGGSIPALAKDQVVEYDISDIVNNGASSINLNWIFSQIVNVGNSQQNFEVYSVDSLGNVKAKRLYVPMFSRQAQVGIVFPFTLNGGTKLRIKPFGDDLIKYDLKISTGSSTSALDSRLTNIEVTGYFGSAKRKLKLTLDRESGSILPIYDYALFSETTGIAPQAP